MMIFAAYYLIYVILGEEALNDMHIHLSGINYGPQRVKKIIFLLRKVTLIIMPGMKAFKDFNIKGCIICESPIL